MLKVGDTVTIKNWEDMAKRYGEVPDMFGDPAVRTRFKFVSGMRRYCGETYTVTYVSPFGDIRLNIPDGDFWVFSEECFEGHDVSTRSELCQGINDYCDKTPCTECKLRCRETGRCTVGVLDDYSTEELNNLCRWIEKVDE